MHKTKSLTTVETLITTTTHNCIMYPCGHKGPHDVNFSIRITFACSIQSRFGIYHDLNGCVFWHITSSRHDYSVLEMPKGGTLGKKKNKVTIVSWILVDGFHCHPRGMGIFDRSSVASLKTLTSRKKNQRMRRSWINNWWRWGKKSRVGEWGCLFLNE